MSATPNVTRCNPDNPTKQDLQSHPGDGPYPIFITGAVRLSSGSHLQCGPTALRDFGAGMQQDHPAPQKSTSFAGSPDWFYFHGRKARKWRYNCPHRCRQPRKWDVKLPLHV